MPCGYYLCEKYQMCFHSSGKTYGSTKAYYHSVKRRIKKMGLVPIKATFDPEGNCLRCGEAGRCPGYHPSNELSLLERSQQNENR